MVELCKTILQQRTDREKLSVFYDGESPDIMTALSYSPHLSAGRASVWPWQWRGRSRSWPASPACCSRTGSRHTTSWRPGYTAPWRAPRGTRAGSGGEKLETFPSFCLHSRAQQRTFFCQVFNLIWKGWVWLNIFSQSQTDVAKCSHCYHNKTIIATTFQTCQCQYCLVSSYSATVYINWWWYIIITSYSFCFFSTNNEIKYLQRNIWNEWLAWFDQQQVFYILKFDWK